MERIFCDHELHAYRLFRANGAFANPNQADWRFYAYRMQQEIEVSGNKREK
jgi:hypothetical protein